MSSEPSSEDDESSCSSGRSARYSYSSISVISEQSFDAENAYYPSSAPYELFIKKMRMCCVTFDFTDLTKNLQEKENKRRTLLQLLDYVNSTSVKFTETVVQTFVEMVSANIFRDLTPQPRGHKPEISLEKDDTRDPSLMHWKLIALEEGERVASNLAWPHLQIVCEIFRRFVVSEQTKKVVANRYINHSFIKRMIDLFDSEDPKERTYLKTILRDIYRKFDEHRPFIRKTINNIFCQFIYEIGKHNGIAEFFEITCIIIKGFKWPLRQENVMFHVRTLIPLYKPRSLATYHEQLSHCIVEFVKRDSKLACSVIKGLIRCWPVTNSLKEVLFLGEVEKVLEVTPEPGFKQCLVPLFHQIFRCLSSSNSRVVERALSYGKNDHMVRLIAQSCEVILPIIFPALERIARHHWKPDIRTLANVVRNKLYAINTDLFNTCHVKFQDYELTEHNNKVRREVTWERLEELAAKNPVIDLQQIINELRASNKVLEKELGMSKLEIRCLHTSSEVIKKELERSKFENLELQTRIEKRERYYETTCRNYEKKLNEKMSENHELLRRIEEVTAENGRLYERITYTELHKNEENMIIQKEPIRNKLMKLVSDLIITVFYGFLLVGLLGIWLQKTPIN